MTSIDRFSEHWLAWIVPASWQVALLVSIVALLTAALGWASPRLRHALWLLVLAKVFLPPGLTLPLGVGQWMVAPVISVTGLSDWSAGAFESLDRPPEAAVAAAGREDHDVASAVAQRGLSPATLVLFCWAAGCLAMWGVVAWRYRQLTRLVRSARSIDEGPLRVALERLALRLDLRRTPDLLVTQVAGAPFMFGVRGPCIVLPQAAVDGLSEAQLHSVLAHELLHVARHDAAIGWLQVLAQSLYWFHPFLWWANSQLRHERECACDQTALELGQAEAMAYSETLLRVLTASRARWLVAGNLVGVFERGAKLHQRLEMIMSYEPSKRAFGWKSRLVICLLAIVLLPMAPGLVRSTPVEAVAAEPEKRTDHPQIVKTSPERGATKVDPKLAKITVTFDRDMRTGMSWTGGGPEFPPLDESRELRWKDARTCVLPVKLEQGKFYRVGINSTSYQNFKSVGGVAAGSSAIYFATEGAAPKIARRVRVPKLVKLAPVNGATNVDPATKVLRATFDVPMGEGWTWANDGSNSPKTPEGDNATWSTDRLTSTLPVKLEAGREYRLLLNDLHDNNFQSQWGVPIAPVVYTFRTRGGGK